MTIGKKGTRTGSARMADFARHYIDEGVQKMKGRAFRLRIFLTAATMSVAFLGAAWAAPQPPGILLKSIDFGSGSLDLFGPEFATPIAQRIDPNRIQDTAKQWADAVRGNVPGLSLIGMSSSDTVRTLLQIKFLVDLRVQKERVDIVTFENERPVTLKLTFRSSVPDQLYLVGGRAPRLLIAAVQTREDYGIGNENYGLRVHREGNVVFLTVYKWPPGDPHMGG